MAQSIDKTVELSSLKGGQLGVLGQLVAVYLVLYVAGFGCATLGQLGVLGQLVAVYLVLYVAGFGCATLGQLVAVYFSSLWSGVWVRNARASYLVGALGQLGGGAGDMATCLLALSFFLLFCFRLNIVLESSYY